MWCHTRETTTTIIIIKKKPSTKQYNIKRSKGSNVNNDIHNGKYEHFYWVWRCHFWYAIKIAVGINFFFSLSLDIASIKSHRFDSIGIASQSGNFCALKLNGRECCQIHVDILIQSVLCRLALQISNKNTNKIETKNGKSRKIEQKSRPYSVIN